MSEEHIMNITYEGKRYAVTITSDELKEAFKTQSAFDALLLNKYKEVLKQILNIE